VGGVNRGGLICFAGFEQKSSRPYQLKERFTHERWAMNFISTKPMTNSETKEPRRCIRCGAEPKLVGTMLDSNKGRTIRMFRCQCGEQTWVSEPA
jgi:hypothetical protein